jgi:hypothetical protein
VVGPISTVVWGMQETPEKLLIEEICVATTEQSVALPLLVEISSGRQQFLTENLSRGLRGLSGFQSVQSAQSAAHESEIKTDTSKRTA